MELAPRRARGAGCLALPHPHPVALLGLLASVLTAPAASSLEGDCFDYAGSLHWVSNVRLSFPTTVAVKGDFAFIGADSSLFGVDLSDLSAPRIVSALNLKTPVGELVWRDDLLYVPADGAGLAIFDVTVPAAPALVSRIDTPGAAFAVALRGDHAFVADFSSGVQVIDVSDPAAPALVTTLATPGFAYDVMALGSLLLVGHGRGFLVADVTDPPAPVVLGNLPTADRVVGVDAAGTLAAAAADSSGLVLIDIANPRAPLLRGMLATPDDAIEVTLNGDKALVAVPWFGLEVVDIADPAHPALAFTLGGTHKPAMSVVVADRLFVPDFSFGVQVFRLGDRWLPPPLGATPTRQVGLALAIDGDQAFLPTWFGDRGLLEVYDISSPAAPTFLAAAEALAYARTIAVAAGMAYVGAPAGIQVFDVSDPRDPVPRSKLALPGGAIAVALGPPGILYALSYGEDHSTFYTVTSRIRRPRRSWDRSSSRGRVWASRSAWHAPMCTATGVSRSWIRAALTHRYKWESSLSIRWISILRCRRPVGAANRWPMCSGSASSRSPTCPIPTPRRW